MFYGVKLLQKYQYNEMSVTKTTKRLVLQRETLEKISVIGLLHLICFINLASYLDCPVIFPIQNIKVQVRFTCQSWMIIMTNNSKVIFV